MSSGVTIVDALSQYFLPCLSDSPEVVFQTREAELDLQVDLVYTEIVRKVTSNPVLDASHIKVSPQNVFFFLPILLYTK